MNEIEYLKKRDDLFERWKNARPEYDGDGKRFTIDGIADYNAWEKSKPKILFLLKENHDEEYEPCWGITVDSKPFSLNIARWRQILHELFVNPNKELSFGNIELPEKINDIAIVEIKKLNERKTISVNKEITHYAEQDMFFLKEQIEIINPDVILCGNTGDAYADNLFEENVWEELIKVSNCKCIKNNNRLVIDFYHPSTRNEGNANELFDILYRMIKEGNVFNKFNWNI